MDRSRPYRVVRGEAEAPNLMPSREPVPLGWKVVAAVVSALLGVGGGSGALAERLSVNKTLGEMSQKVDAQGRTLDTIFAKVQALEARQAPLAPAVLDAAAVQRAVQAALDRDRRRRRAARGDE